MFRKLLVPLDQSALAEQALGHATAIARASHAGIDVVSVHDPLLFAGLGGAPLDAKHVLTEEAYLASISAELTSGGAVPATHAVLHGETVPMICARARDVGADLIVMTSHGRTGLGRALLGSIADGVLKHSTIPVLMLRPVETTGLHSAAPHMFKRILVPVDGSALAMGILSSVAALARCSNARLILLRVVQPVPAVGPADAVPFAPTSLIEDEDATQRVAAEAKDGLADIRQTLEADGVAEVEAHVVIGRLAGRAILDFARGNEIDGIAMSTHGRGLSRFFYGSVAAKVLHDSHVPVLLRRPDASDWEANLIDTADIESQLPAMTGG